MRILALVGLLLSFCFAAFAQSSSGTILGSVRDAQDAAIPNATVSVTNVKTQVTRSFTTTESGSYVVPFLDPGQYAIVVEAQGFKKATRSGIVLQVADKLSIDFGMTVGAMSEQITVEATTPLVNATNSTLGQVIENRRIVDLPLNGREPFALAFLSPGVLPTPNNSAQHQGGSIPSISGASNFSSEVTIDGMPNTTPRNAARQSFLIYTPSVDAVEEFKVQTNAMSAEFGRFNGGVISVVTKSGTNTVHGTLYEFHRNSYFDANNFFNNRSGIPLGALRRNQIGGAIGGPVIIPKVYNGKDRTFFFFDYEAFREATLATASYTVPTALERQGDFSQTRNTAGALVQIYDPATTRRDAAGTGFMRDAFPGNIIPASRMSPIGQKLVGFYPLPNNSQVTNNLNLSSSRINKDDTFDIRLDHYIGDKHKLFGRYSQQFPFTGEPNYFGNIANPGNPSLTQRRFSFTAQDVWTMTPTTIVNISYGLARMFGTRTAWSEGYDITELGFPSSFRDAQQVRALPGITVGNFAGLGNTNQNYSTQLSHTFLATATRIHGSHTTKYGFDYRAYYINQLQNTAAQGNLSFNTNWTQGPNPNQATATAGRGLATMLLGIPNGSITIQPAYAARSSYVAGFIQDDWKLTQRLTLNLGLRYDVSNPRTERFDRISTFDLDAPSPIASQVPSLPGLKGAMGLRGPGDRRLGPTDWNNIGPRFGFAYQLMRTTVLRGSYGIFYGLSPTDAAGPSGGFADGFNAVTSIVASLDGVNPISTAANPFPNGINQPLPREQMGPGFLLGQSINSVALSLATPYFQQWNFSVQQSIGNSIVAEIAYAANKGTHTQLGTFLSLNSLTQEQTLLGAANQTLVPNPFYGIITDPTSALSQPTISRGTLLRPYPQYSSVNAPYPSIGNAIYHSFQARMEKRFSHGFTALAAYTMSKNINDSATDAVGATTGLMDPWNLRLERSLDANDVSQRIVVSGMYELPFGKGKWLGGSWNRPLDALLGGWQVNAIGSFQTGEPLVMTAISGSRPNRIATGEKYSGPVQERMNKYFDTSAFAVPVAFTFGNSSRTAPDLRTPGMNNWDMSLFKNLQIVERLKAQLRFESFNALNRVRFGSPGTSAGSNNFGMITSQINSPRQLQVAMKLIF